MNKVSREPTVVIIGGGFGGLNAAQKLGNKSVKVILIDKRNFHLFQPLLYQVATGGLSPADISSPLRSILKKYQNIEIRKDTVVEVDPDTKKLITNSGDIVYDYLIIATGAHHYYFGHDQWESMAPGLKTIENATDIRSRVLDAFERAEVETDPEKIKELLTFVIVGAGPTGIEMAGAIGEMAINTLVDDFNNINTADAKIYLIEGLDRALPGYPPILSTKAGQALESLGIEIMTGTMVTDVEKRKIKISRDKEDSWINTQTVIWAAGTQASSLGKNIAEKTGLQTDKQGRLFVNSFCQIEKFPEVFIIGDLAHFDDSKLGVLPGVAQVAIQQGKYVAGTVMKQVKQKQIKPFHYSDRGNMAVIGRKAAVAQIGKIKISGFVAWLLWLFIHLMYLVGFQNKLLVIIQWAYNYFTRNSSARIIANYKNIYQNN
jgi:NADH dehydrogenase